ncbi:RNA polymerase sigma factor [Streptomyces sp. NPDC052043]|uniref:RNA polymerase sigma factor n=1 Tax=Streptomyces sp. NPDC052043 TaxID=3365684 RepID=UPI0037D02F89
MTNSHANPLPSPTGDRRSGTAASLTADQPVDAADTPLTPAQAFDALYRFCAPALVRQAYLLTGRHEGARESVEQAFQLAWQRWPEVARDRDPAGWVRAMAYDCALSPWHRFRRRDRAPDAPSDPADRALQRALMLLPPSYRRALVLYDGVGLGLPETAAETEASTPATANRLMHARQALAACLPELSDPAELRRRLIRLASAERLGAGEPEGVRTAGERLTRFWTRSAVALTATVIGATTLTLRTAPTHHLAPVSPGHVVQEAPAQDQLGPLPPEALRLHAADRKTPVGPPPKGAGPPDRLSVRNSADEGGRAQLPSEGAVLSCRGWREPAWPSRSGSCRP